MRQVHEVAELPRTASEYYMQPGVKYWKFENRITKTVEKLPTGKHLLQKYYHGELSSF
jgi:hypothetical protein